MATNDLVGTLETTTVTLVSIQRVTRRAIRWFVVPLYWALYVVCVGALVLVGIALWRARQTGVWHTFWARLRASFFSSDGPILWLYLALGGSLAENYSKDTLRIREAALAGDERLAPVADEQPDGTLAPNLPGEPVIVGALRRPGGGNTATRRGASLSFAIVFAVFALVFLALLIAIPSAGARVVFAIFLALFAFLAFGFWRVRRRTSLTVHVQASAFGLEWETEKRHSAAWHEVQAFLMYRRGEKEAHPGSAVYAIETRHGMLTWELRSNASEEERRAHDRLICVVARYSGQPLRDLSKSEQIVHDEDESSNAPETPAPSEPDGMPATRNPHMRQDRGRHPNWGCLSFLILSGAVLLLALAGVILQHV